MGGFDRSLEDWGKRKKIEHTLYEAGFTAGDFASICWGNEERGMAIEFRSKIVANATFGRLETIRLRAPAGEGTYIRRKEAGMKTGGRIPKRPETWTHRPFSMETDRGDAQPTTALRRHLPTLLRISRG